MPIMTLNDRIVLIDSHMDSIKRALKRGDDDSLNTVGQFMDSIAKVAAEGSEQLLHPEGPGGV